MGNVYRAEQGKLGRKVALKVLSQELAESEEFRSRFLTESHLAATIEHPNILPIFDAGESDGLLYIAMRLIDGTEIDLQALLDREGALPPERALAIVAQVAGALDVAHSHDLVHRDIKPGNILLAGDHAYLTDFGIAKPVAARRELTRTGAFVGTLDYASPEQIRNDPLDGATDVYSLGAVLFHCLTGQVPFDRSSEYGVMKAHLEEPPPLPSERGLPQALDQVIATALAKAPDERFRSARKMVEAAQAALEGRVLAGMVQPTKIAPAIAPTHVARALAATTVPAPQAAASRSGWLARATAVLLAVGVLGGAGAAATALVAPEQIMRPIAGWFGPPTSTPSAPSASATTPRPSTPPPSTPPPSTPPPSTPPPPPVRLTVTFAGSGGGSYRIDGGFLRCDTAFSAPQTGCRTHLIEAGSNTTITAAAAGGSVFAGWLGACQGIAGPTCTVNMTGDRETTVVFEPPAPASTAPAPPPPTPGPTLARSGVAGYDAAYQGGTDFLNLRPGEAGQFSVMFANTGTTTWVRGQVVLLVCLQDKVTCGVDAGIQRRDIAAYAEGWFSPTAYATVSRDTPPGSNAFFTYNIRVPPGTPPGTRAVFNGEVGLLDGRTFHPEGKFQLNTVPR